MNELDKRDINIDGVVDKTRTLFLDAASESLGTFKTNYVPPEKKKVRRPQPWFDYTPAMKLGGLYWNDQVRLSVRLSVCSAAFGFTAHNCFPFTPIIMTLHM